MAAITHVFTAARVAQMLGVEEDVIHDASDGLDPEDGRLWVYDDTEHGVLAFTEAGIEILRYCLEEAASRPKPP
jgi:hypothetical protein